MFRFVPPSLPGFRVGLTEDPPTFRIDSDGSVRGDSASSSNPPSFAYDSYGNAQSTARSTDLGPSGIASTGQATFGLPGTNQTPTDPSAQQWAAAQSCAAAHRACLLSGRPWKPCLQALYNCSQNGVPTIFAPGIWGEPV
jgi:hypothetical protein